MPGTGICPVYLLVQQGSHHCKPFGLDACFRCRTEEPRGTKQKWVLPIPASGPAGKQDW